jgi:hypothetical protein
VLSKPPLPRHVQLGCVLGGEGGAWGVCAWGLGCVCLDLGVGLVVRELNTHHLRGHVTQRPLSPCTHALLSTPRRKVVSPVAWIVVLGAVAVVCCVCGGDGEGGWAVCTQLLEAPSLSHLPDCIASPPYPSCPLPPPAGMKESREKTITVDEWSYVTFTAMLEFLYTGSVVDLGAEVRVVWWAPFLTPFLVFPLPATSSPLP